MLRAYSVESVTSVAQAHEASECMYLDELTLYFIIDAPFVDS